MAEEMQNLRNELNGQFAEYKQKYDQQLKVYKAQLNAQKELNRFYFSFQELFS